MNRRDNRLDAIKMIISSREIGSQDELLQALAKEGYALTQATLSRDLKQLKVAKAANAVGRYVYVLPNDVMYKRSVREPGDDDVRTDTGFLSLRFSGNVAVIRTKPGYASRLAYDIDNTETETILGTIAGDDTIMLVVRENIPHDEVRDFLSQIIPNIN